MARNKSHKEINLLPKEFYYSSMKGRVFKWILTSFRIIVIVTEMIVMIAFISRFFLDTKNSDLNEELQQKKAIISASLEFEKEFKHKQKQLSTVAQFYSTKSDYSDTIKKISTNLPSSVYLTELSVNNDEIKIVGLSPNESGIQQFIANLNSNTDFKNISLAKINSGGESGSSLEFDLNLSKI